MLAASVDDEQARLFSFTVPLWQIHDDVLFANAVSIVYFRRRPSSQRSRAKLR